jgi:hypothetical protein
MGGGHTVICRLGSKRWSWGWGERGGGGGHSRRGAGSAETAACPSPHYQTPIRRGRMGRGGEGILVGGRAGWRAPGRAAGLSAGLAAWLRRPADAPTEMGAARRGWMDEFIGNRGGGQLGGRGSVQRVLGELMLKRGRGEWCGGEGGVGGDGWITFRGGATTETFRGDLTSCLAAGKDRSGRFGSSNGSSSAGSSVIYRYETGCMLDLMLSLAE